LTLRPSGDYLARTSAFWIEGSFGRRHYIRSLQPVAPADPAAEALDRARAAWISGRDGRRLRRELLGLLAELAD
jgi:hypothetical protein